MAHQFYFPETQDYSLNILWVSATGRVRGVLDVARDTETNMYNLKRVQSNVESEKQGGYCNQVVRDNKGLNYVEKEEGRKA